MQSNDMEISTRIKVFMQECAWKRNNDGEFPHLDVMKFKSTNMAMAFNSK